MAAEPILGFGFYINVEANSYVIEFALARTREKHRIAFSDAAAFGHIALLVNNASHFAFDPDTREIQIGGGRLPSIAI
ncbi:hypothetical protein GWI72_14005 [Microvirga tunisiensis]|uniref:Uncharacterized protein n=2 Tax=Pannonibacter tanglangensis TaxID=2750084 RepID=A0A7X5F412_9HYPH|nr:MULTISPECIES: hypothetical protein [unclassified Pannonibacter]NBN64884.1 hypothetical protein [Pannonibacter sp. XCT-34]NBN79387.1 hypothetical protein [Pannonibacter sp. XCT-53]